MPDTGNLHLGRTKVLYAIALAIIALTVLSSSLLVQLVIRSSQGDSRSINLAGRQRMLSQRLTKLALALEHATGSDERARRHEELVTSLRDWKQAHRGLQHGDPSLGLPARVNSAEVRALFAELEPSHERMARALDALADRPADWLATDPGRAALAQARDTLLRSEQHFLTRMDRITFLFDSEAKARIASMERIELAVATLGLLVLAFEGLFIFRPSLRQIHALVESVRGQREALRASNAELSAANAELLRSLERADALTKLANASSEAKGAFLATMSHEIRTPMNGVLGITELLLAGELSAPQRAYADIIKKSGEQLLAVVNDILDYSKLAAGMMKLDLGDFDPRAATEDVLDLHAARAFAAHVELVLDVADGVPAAVRGDVGRLRQVIGNLVGNAVKFSPGGEVVVRLETLAPSSPPPQSQGKLVLRCSVDDTGVGIPAERIGDIFAPFVQADASSARRFGGTGLGLSISRQIVERMGGHIEARSTLGKGSTFTFTVSLEEATAAAPAPALLLPPEAGRVRALVVERCEPARTAAVRTLGSLGVDAVGVADAVAALARLEEAAAGGAPFRLALVQQDSSAGAHLELARQVSGDPSLAGVVLILMHHLAEFVDFTAVEAVGFQVPVAKPLRLQQLHACVELALCPAVSTRPRPKADGLPSDGASTAPWRVAPALTRPPTPVPSAPPSSPPPTPVPSAPPRLAPTPTPEFVPLPPVVREGPPPSVLVVEDNFVNQQVAQALLQKLGCVCEIAASGHAALAALERAPFSVVFMDCQMPDLDGFETTARIRSPDSRVLNRAVPIVAMTANAFAGDRDRCLAAGMDDYVPKPIGAEALARALRRWLPAAPSP